jgi:hypothetical protein
VKHGCCCLRRPFSIRKSSRSFHRRVLSIRTDDRSNPHSLPRVFALRLSDFPSILHLSSHIVVEYSSKKSSAMSPKHRSSLRPSQPTMKRSAGVGDLQRNRMFSQALRGLARSSPSLVTQHLSPPRTFPFTGSFSDCCR